ncbi:hypothetical protein [Desulfovibrio sp. TomC]|uniref:hypothetical protein n=1 Tax=Desulfovibrio sp. TomC TaxID=1562888 RepID=UPI000573C6F4|nr:hypothetical protein [Desulfovibrio sp. TomC]KHK03697.1 Polysaccharide deacetylase [Desulfovibrio sp. TomC]
MRKFFRYLFQYAILVAFGYFVYQTAFKKDTPPVHDRAAWTQRDGFVALGYGGITIDENVHSLVSKSRLREHLTALAKAGYKTITTSDLVDFYEKNKPLPEKALYLMFEGGRKDSVLFSQPVLTGVGFNAALYLYGDRLTGWQRFFVRRSELRKIADNPFWDVGSMGYHSELINQTPSGGYAYYLTERLAGAAGASEETQEAYDARVAADFTLARQSIEDLAGKAPLGYLFMPANTLGVSLPAAEARPNEAALAKNFPVAFTRVGETYNPRDANPRGLTRMQVAPDWTADRLLLEIESRQPKSRYMDFSQSVRQGLWQVTLGDMAVMGQSLTMTAPVGKDGFARLRGSEGFENFLCEVKTTPPDGGASTIYLRYRDAGSFVRIRTTAERVMVQEKNGPSLNTIFQYVLPLDHTGPVAFDLCVKGNRLLLGVDGKNVSRYPIPLTADTIRGSFALGAADEDDPTPEPATFTDLTLSTFPPRWISAPTIGDVPLGDARTLTAVVLPADTLQADPLRDAAALITASVNGVGVHLDLTGQGPEAVLQTVHFVETAPASMVFAKLLRGFVLPLGGPGDLGQLKVAIDTLHAKGFSVALRVDAAWQARLLDLDRALSPDWLLFDTPPPADDSALTALENRFDRTRMLFRAASQAGSQTVSYDVKR